MNTQTLSFMHGRVLTRSKEVEGFKWGVMNDIIGYVSLIYTFKNMFSEVREHKKTWCLVWAYILLSNISLAENTISEVVLLYVLRLTFISQSHARIICIVRVQHCKAKGRRTKKWLSVLKRC